MINQTIRLYEGRQDATLRSYVIEDSPELLAGKRRPAVLICPGGAYLSCSDREAEPVALRFASMGYHAFVLRYSTYGGGKGGFPALGADMAVNPRSVHPAPMRDIGRAFLIIREHAAEWLVDTGKIALCGFSAGAHNCAMYSAYWDGPEIAGFFGEKPEAFKPAAAILGYGLFDYGIMVGDFKDPMGKLLSEAATLAIMGTKAPTREQLDALSPSLRAAAAFPPTFIWATGGDELVPPENSLRLASALGRAGVSYELHVFEGGPHGLALADQSTAGSRFELDERAAAWVSMAESWLEKRFALPLAEMPVWMRSLPAGEGRGGAR